MSPMRQRALASQPTPWDVATVQEALAGHIVQIVEGATDRMGDLARTYTERLVQHFDATALKMESLETRTANAVAELERLAAENAVLREELAGMRAAAAGRAAPAPAVSQVETVEEGEAEPGEGGVVDGGGGEG